MSKHTKGPWTVTHNSWETSSVYGPNDELIAECQIDSDVDENTQQVFEDIKEANANLIGAAPDLLEALDKLTGWAESLRVSGDAGNWEWEDDEYTQAIAALNKARGQA